MDRLVKLMLLCTFMFAASSCGGGGGTITYYPFMGGSCDRGYVGYAYTCTPNVGNLPPGSTPNITATNLPPGLTMNPATGTVSGVPTSQGSYFMDLRMTASGASGVVSFSMSVQIDRPASDAWTLTNVSTAFPRFASQAAAALGSDLYLVGSREDNLAVETWRSSDLGITWVKLLITPPLAVKDFALASDGTRMLLTGGRDATNLSSNLVFVFQGGAWQAVPGAGAIYSARWGHSLTVWNGAWWIIGGTSGSAAGSNAMADVWRSLDNGASWSQTTNDLGSAASFSYGMFAPSYGHCSGIVNNMLVKVGGSNSINARAEGNTLLIEEPVRLWQSADGINWTISTANSQSAYTAAGCATVNGVLHYIGGTRMNPQDLPVQRDQGFYVWSSMWTFDGNSAITLIDSVPKQFNGSPAFQQRFGAATAVIGNKLFVIGGRFSNAPDTSFNDVWVSSR